MRNTEPSPIGIVIPLSSQEREAQRMFDREVDISLRRLEDLLGIAFHTKRTGSELNGDSYVTYATRNGKYVTFKDGVHHGNRYRNIIGITFGDSRSSILHYVLHNVTELSTKTETMSLPLEANTVDELAMKANIQQDSLVWWRR